MGAILIWVVIPVQKYTVLELLIAYKFKKKYPGKKEIPCRTE
jgi:hypothetical protein